MGMHDRYCGDGAKPKPQKKAKAEQGADTPSDTAQHLLDALNADVANALTNERLKDGDKK